MAQRDEATPGTAFIGPLYVVDDDGEITGQVATELEEDVEHTALTTVADTTGETDQADAINGNFAELLSLITDVAAAVGITVAEAA